MRRGRLSPQKRPAACQTEAQLCPLASLDAVRGGQQHPLVNGLPEQTNRCPSSSAFAAINLRCTRKWISVQVQLT